MIVFRDCFALEISAIYFLIAAFMAKSVSISFHNCDKALKPVPTQPVNSSKVTSSQQTPFFGVDDW